MNAAELVDEEGAIDLRAFNGSTEAPAKVSAAMCADMRERVRNGATLTAVGHDHGVCHTTTSDHVRGRCRHAIDAEPVEGEQ